MTKLILGIAMVMAGASATAAQERVSVTRKSTNFYEVQLDPTKRVIETSLCLELALMDDAILDESRAKLIFSSGSTCDVKRVLTSRPATRSGGSSMGPVQPRA